MPDQLLKGVDTFAAAAWSGSGFADAAELEVSVHFLRIIAGLNQDAYRIKSLDFNSGSEGTVGGGDEGPLVVGGDNTTDSRVRNLGKVDLHLEAGGANNKIENVHTGHPLAHTRLFSNEFETVSINAGRLSAAETSIIDELIIIGGKSNVAYKSNAIATLYMKAGYLNLQRAATAITVGEGAVLDLDPDTAADLSGTSILLMGGKINWYGGAVPSITAIGGEIDFRVARGKIEAADLGGTTFDVAGTLIHPNPIVELDNLAPMGAIARNDSNVVQFGGAPILV